MSHIVSSLEQYNLERRVSVEYNDHQRALHNCDQDLFKTALRKMKLKGKGQIYDNQEQTALSIMSDLVDKKILNIMITALTQSGKTGCMLSLAEKLILSGVIPVENIYIITGLSSCAWQEQTKDRLPEILQKRVYHRNRILSEFVPDIKGKKNVLVIIDEVQIAASALGSKKQTIHNALAAAGFYNKQTLFKNDVKIVEFTATPDGTIYDLMNWGENSKKRKLFPGDRYISAFELLRQKRVKQYKDLLCYNKTTGESNPQAISNIRELKNTIDQYTSKKYHIVRTHNAGKGDMTINNFKQVFNEEDYNYITFNRESEIEDINQILNISPNKHTFIFIKEKLRCAITLSKKFLGVAYERKSSNPDDSCILQGLIGRLTGYDDSGETICFTNIDSIRRYKVIWDSNFEDLTVRWRSKTTKMKNGQIVAKSTMNNPALINGEEVEDVPNTVHRIAEFDDVYGAVKFCKDYFKAKVDPEKRLEKKINNHFVGTIGNSRKKVWSMDEIKSSTGRGLTKKGYRLTPCYTDTTDHTTIKWTVTYDPNRAQGEVIEPYNP